MQFRYRYFGSFRLLLACLVMLQHFAADASPEPLMRIMAPYGFGNMAVLTFFALSGFVITEAVDCFYRSRAVSFMANRLLRIVPHFVLAMVLAMAAHAVFIVAHGQRLWRSQPSFPADAFDPVNVVLNFTGFLPAIDRLIHYNFLDIAWAVRVEMAFYIVMAGCILGGRLLPSPRGYAWVAGIVSVLLMPVGIMAAMGKGVSMLSFVSYFTFGAGLYFATIGARAGLLMAAVSLPQMLWCCVMQQSAAAANHIGPVSIGGNLAMLVLLLAALTGLAFVRSGNLRRTDSTLGDLTYPLYLYHQDVLILVLTFTTGYSYAMFAVAVVASVAVATALASLVDPVIARYRNRMRGTAVRAGTQAAVPAFATTAPTGSA